MVQGRRLGWFAVLSFSKQLEEVQMMEGVWVDLVCKFYLGGNVVFGMVDVDRHGRFVSLKVFVCEFINSIPCCYSAWLLKKGLSTENFVFVVPSLFQAPSFQWIHTSCLKRSSSELKHPARTINLYVGFHPTWQIRSWISLTFHNSDHTAPHIKILQFHWWLVLLPPHGLWMSFEFLNYFFG